MVLVWSGPSFCCVLSTLWMYCNVLAILLLMRFGVVFQFEAVMNKAAMNDYVQFFVSICFSSSLGTYLGVGFIDMRALPRVRVTQSERHHVWVNSSLFIN